MSNSVKFFRVGMASCGIAAGADKVFDALKEKTSLPVLATGCLGHCYAEPVVEAVLTDGSSLFYRDVTVSDVENILQLADSKRFETFFFIFFPPNLSRLTKRQFFRLLRRSQRLLRPRYIHHLHYRSP